MDSHKLGEVGDLLLDCESYAPLPSVALKEDLGWAWLEDSGVWLGVPWEIGAIKSGHNGSPAILIFVIVNEHVIAEVIVKTHSGQEAQAIAGALLWSSLRSAAMRGAQGPA